MNHRGGIIISFGTLQNYYFEHKMDIITYINQLLHWSKGILLVDGPRKLVKSFGLGIIHALLDELGYIDSKYFK